MVNASLNWASIVGIVLAVGGALLYFMRSFKPALARDYDVFFAAVGLLCGGILFFQGWRLDPILQFGQFLLAGTTVFFAYESVRLRGVTTEQARRSSYFDDEEPAPPRPRGGLGGDRDWERGGPERFDQVEPLRRRISSREVDEDEFYRPRRPSRAAIPERAASRRGADDWDEPRDSRPEDREADRGASGREPSRYASPRRNEPEFGTRRRERETGGDSRRGSRIGANPEPMPRSSRRGSPLPPRSGDTAPLRQASSPGVPLGEPIRPAGGGEPSGPRAGVSDADFTPVSSASRRPRPDDASRDNSSRFDD